MPEVVNKPPKNVVVLKPNLSTNIPEIGLNRKVAPIVNDPTRAVEEKKEIMRFAYNQSFLWLKTDFC